MPSGSGDVPNRRTETRSDLRDMAARARRLARNILDQQMIRQLIELAEELEARASALDLTPKPIPIERSDPEAGQD
jgi:hypothetical protein